ncbi:MAG TPA: outer membrane beta-barrel protein [bacterium]|nr:outer membrane beta-barrel protein [bacterium]
MTPLLAAVLISTSAGQLSLGGLVDFYGSYNSSHPALERNFEPGTGVAAARANTFSLNAATIDVALTSGPVAAHVVLGAGDSFDVVHAAEPEGFRHVYQASASYRPWDATTIEAGIFPPHVGVESFFTKDNWNYSRSWLAEWSPYYEAGVKVSQTFDEHWSAQLHVLNGWQQIVDVNEGKTIGTQVAFTTRGFSASFNTLAGPENATDPGWRLLGDLVLAASPTSWLSLSAAVDKGHEALPFGRAAEWEGAELLARVHSTRFAIVARGESFRDRVGLISGFAQTVSEGTLTLEARPEPVLIVRLEGRYDRSTAEAFPAHVGLRKDQALVLVGASASF